MSQNQLDLNCDSSTGIEPWLQWIAIGDQF